MQAYMNVYNIGQKHTI